MFRTVYVLKPGDHGKFSAEDRRIEGKRYFRVAVEVNVGIDLWYGVLILWVRTLLFHRKGRNFWWAAKHNPRGGS